MSLIPTLNLPFRNTSSFRPPHLPQTLPLPSTSLPILSKTGKPNLNDYPYQHTQKSRLARKTLPNGSFFLRFAWRENGWWRRGELNPCPKTRPHGLLRAQTIYSHSLCRAPLVRLTVSVASLCMARSKLCALTCTTKSRPHPGPWSSRAGRLR